MEKKIYNSEAVQQIGRMLRAANISKYSVLSKVLGESQSTISSWKIRGVPEAKLFKAATLIGCKIDWLRQGEGEMHCSLGCINEKLAQYDLSGKVNNNFFLEAAAAVQRMQKQVGSYVRPERLGALILMLHDFYATGENVPQATILEWVRLTTL